MWRDRTWPISYWMKSCVKHPGSLHSFLSFINIQTSLSQNTNPNLNYILSSTCRFHTQYTLISLFWLTWASKYVWSWPLISLCVLRVFLHVCMRSKCPCNIRLERSRGRICWCQHLCLKGFNASVLVKFEINILIFSLVWKLLFLCR